MKTITKAAKRRLQRDYAKFIADRIEEFPTLSKAERQEFLNYTLEFRDKASGKWSKNLFSVTYDYFVELDAEVSK